LSDEQKKAYLAYWILKLNKKNHVAGVNDKPLYLTNAVAKPLVAMGAIAEFNESQS